MRHERCEMLFGDNYETIKALNILIIGVGGVGGHCLDALYRTGVQNITIIDFDTYDETNQNRQIGSECVGESKVRTLMRRYEGVKGFDVKITPEWVAEFDFEPYNFVVDAIDDVASKCALIVKCHKKIICSMGSAKRIDPTMIEVTKLSKTHNDPLSKKVRDELKKLGSWKDPTVVFSPETPLTKSKGSFVGVTGAFGLVCASYMVRKTLEQTPIKND
jgi:tRNA threonylcarbamoyladenosine dehydratase